MILNRNYSYWSTLFAVVGFLLFMAIYLISPDDPQGIIVDVMKVMLSVAVVLLVSGIVTSILAMKNKEVGVKKYVGILLPVFMILFAILIPILMGIGFLINDRP